jgi:hypothetical protein
MSKIFLLLSLHLLISIPEYSQSPERINKNNGANWIIYNTSNSALPSNTISSIAIDGSGNKWIGTGGGLVKFNGTNFIVADTNNSDLPDDGISSIAIEGRTPNGLVLGMED